MNTENNKRIAKFMGIYSVDELLYDTDWNLLMNVVGYIEGLHQATSVIIGKNHCILQYYDKYKNESILFSSESKYANLELSKIQATYKAIIDFIDWYNKNIEQSKEFIRDKFLELKKIPPNILQENYEKTKKTINKYWCNCENKTNDNKLKCPLHDRDNV